MLEPAGFSRGRPLRRALGALVAIVTAIASVPLLATSTAAPALALSNGLAQTPPMGFNDWNAFHCNVSEQLIEQTADFFVSSGMKDAGYTYVNIDDCWLSHSRDASGNLVPDPVKFPDGIAGVATFVHARGLKLGIYEDAGTSTCAGFPGSLGHERQDATRFASWGIDYLKYDNCHNNSVPAPQRYTAMRDALLATGRPIVYSICNWGQESPWTWGPTTGNLWRTTGDIGDNWARMLSIVHANLPLASHAGPGHWNDPDMLEIGNGGMTDTEYRSHLSLWAEMAAPLLAGTDLRKASAATMAIYLNRNVIAVDQDPLGVQGTLVSRTGTSDVLTKALGNGDRAVVLFNEGTATATISTTAAAVGLPSAGSYTLTDLWSNQVSQTSGTISASVPGHGVVMYRASAGSSSGGNDFSIGVTPGSQTVAPGASAAYTVTTAVTSGSTSSIALSASGLPSGATASFSANPVTAGQSSTLTVTTGSSTPLGSATVSVTGSNGTSTHSASAGLMVASGGTGPTSYEAESPANRLSGGARVAACSACSGGHKVGFVGHGGTLQFNRVTEAAAGSYQLTIAYTDGDAGRSADMSINGGSPTILHFTGTGSFSTPGRMVVTVSLNAGTNTITFSNPTAWAPDFDRIIV
jgi:alpha-galactosidase